MKKKWKWAIAVIAVFIIGTAGISLKIYSDIKNTAAEIYTPLQEQTSAIRSQPVAISSEVEPFSALVLGVDERDGDVGRSDTMIVLTVNPTLQTTKMLSIPRDTYTEIAGKGYHDKINHAYSFGGIEMAMKTVENLLAIPIDYAAKVDMEGFVDIIDIVGGITVDNPFEFDYEGEHFPMGEMALDGEKSLKYVRMRYEDPMGDFGRQSRQKQVVQGVLKEGMSLSTLWNYQEIFKTIEQHIEVNAALEELLYIRKNYRQSFQKIEQLYMNEGEAMIKNRIYYYVPNRAELTNLQTILKNHLEI